MASSNYPKAFLIPDENQGADVVLDSTSEDIAHAEDLNRTLTSDEALVLLRLLNGAFATGKLFNLDQVRTFTVGKVKELDSRVYAIFIQKAGEVVQAEKPIVQYLGENTIDDAEATKIEQEDAKRNIRAKARFYATTQVGTNEDILQAGEEFLKLQPNNLTALLKLADVCLVQGDYAKAKDYAKRAILTNPTLDNGAKKMGHILHDEAHHVADFDLAIGLLQEAQRLQPEDIDIRTALAYKHIARANDFYAKGNQDLAVEDYQEAVRLGYDGEELLTMLGEYYESKNLYNIAQEFYTKILHSDPTNVKALYSSLKCYMEDGKSLEALSLSFQAFSLVKKTYFLEQAINIAIENPKVAEEFGFSEKLLALDPAASILYINKLKAASKVPSNDLGTWEVVDAMDEILNAPGIFDNVGKNKKSGASN